MTEMTTKAHSEGKVASCYIGDIYEVAWQIRGYERFLMDMLVNPSWAECLLERVTERNLILAKACALAGIDLIQCGDDVANQNTMMFNPEIWRKMIHSRWKTIWKAIKEINPKLKYGITVMIILRI